MNLEPFVAATRPSTTFASPWANLRNLALSAARRIPRWTNVTSVMAKGTAFIPRPYSRPLEKFPMEGSAAQQVAVSRRSGHERQRRSFVHLWLALCLLVQPVIGFAQGTVVAWGGNYSGQATVPAGLTDVTAIAADASHSLALRSDGTVVAWGYNAYGQSTIPAGLTGVTAIAAGGAHNLALRSDGTVVAWGYNDVGQTDIPAGLTGVIAIAAGVDHSLALQSDGTLVAWGDNEYGQTTIPAGLSGVTAIAAGGMDSLALRSDGTVVAWGRDLWGQITVPTGLAGVTAIAAGHGHSLALKNALTPQMAISDLKDYISSQTTIRFGIRTALFEKLNELLTALAVHNLPAACEALQDFINLVRAQRGRHITAAQADYMIAQASDIQLLMGCP